MVLKLTTVFGFVRTCICILAKIDPSLSHHETIVYKDELYLFGGNFSGGAYQITPVKLNLLKPTKLPPTYWNTATEDLDKLKLPGLTGHRVALDEALGKLYLIGGRPFDSNFRASQIRQREKIQFWVYDFGTGIWEDLSLRDHSILPPSRYFHTLTYNSGKIYLFGGRSLDDSMTFGDFYVYNIDKNVWNQVSFSNSKYCPTPRSEHSATLISRNRILILGGKDQEEVLDINMTYSISTDDFRCSKRAVKTESSPSDRFSFTATAYQSKVIMIGGIDKDFNIRSEMYYLDIEKMFWSPIITEGLVPRVYHSTAAYGQALLISYGALKNPDDSVQVFKQDSNAILKSYHPDMKNEGSIYCFDIGMILGITAGCLLSILLPVLGFWYIKRRRRNNTVVPSSKFLNSSIFTFMNNDKAETLSSSGKFTSGLWSDNYFDYSHKSTDHNASMPVSNIEMKMHIDDITLQLTDSTRPALNSGT